jgi:hypothetical protein
LISAGWTDPPQRITNFFHNTANAFEEEKIFQIQRVWISKKDSWHRLLCNVYLPAFLYNEVFEDTAFDIAILHGMVQSDKYAGSEIKTVEAIHPWICDTKAAQHLGIMDGTPVFQVIWKVYSEKDTPLWISEDISTATSIISEMRTRLPKQSTTTRETGGLDFPQNGGKTKETARPRKFGSEPRAEHAVCRTVKKR